MKRFTIWAGVLLAAMAYVVVPMFQLTPGYPVRPSWWFPVVMLAMLLAWSLAVLADWAWLVRLSQLVAAMAGIGFAGLTLRLQSKRRRARSDATYRFWQLGLGSTIFALFLLLTAALWPAVSCPSSPACSTRSCLSWPGCTCKTAAWHGSRRRP